MPAHIDLLAFDLDGTLVDSAPDLCVALGAALQSVGCAAPTQTQTRGWIGGGVENLLKRALTAAGVSVEETFADALAEFHKTYTDNLFTHSRLYPNVIATLSALQSSGVSMCCITNKRIVYTEALLKLAGLDGFFEIAYGGDSFANKKPHPVQLQSAAAQLGANVAKCVMIGDSGPDHGAALAAGFQFIWASFGYAQLRPGAADERFPEISQFADIPDVLSTLPTASPV